MMEIFYDAVENFENRCILVYQHIWVRPDSQYYLQGEQPIFRGAVLDLIAGTSSQILAQQTRLEKIGCFIKK